jgi:hypothetical protein
LTWKGMAAIPRRSTCPTCMRTIISSLSSQRKRHEKTKPGLDHDHGTTHLSRSFNLILSHDYTSVLPARCFKFTRAHLLTFLFPAVDVSCLPVSAWVFYLRGGPHQNSPKHVMVP